MNRLAQEVATHLKNRVLSINEEFNVQGINAEQMYQEANHEISSLRRSLESLNQRYMVAQSELSVAASSAEEVARQHAKELFNKDLERQETVRLHYRQKSIQQGIIIDLQQKLLNEESSLQVAQQRIYDRRHEVHDVQLELNEALEHNQKCDSQIAMYHAIKDRMEGNPFQHGPTSLILRPVPPHQAGVIFEAGATGTRPGGAPRHSPTRSEQTLPRTALLLSCRCQGHFRNLNLSVLFLPLIPAVA